MLTLLMILSAIGVTYAITPSCHELHKTQLASLGERMNQMINSLYTSPLASKAESNTTPASIPPALPASDYPGFPYNTYYPYPPYSMPVPQVVYVSPSHVPPPVPFIPPTAVESSIKPFKNPYLSHKETVQPFDYPMDVSSPWSHYYDHYPYTQYPTPQYPPVPYQPLPYSPPYSYPEYPAYPKMTQYPSTPIYQPPPQLYPPPPTHYPLPSLYHKTSEMPPPPYYL